MINVVLFLDLFRDRNTRRVTSILAFADFVRKGKEFLLHILDIEWVRRNKGVATSGQVLTFS